MTRPHVNIATLTTLAIIAVVIAAMPASAAVGDTEWSHTRHGSNIVDIGQSNDLIVSADSGQLQAAAASDGSQQRTYSDSNINAVSNIKQNRVMVGTDDFIVAVDTTDGTQIESDPTLSNEPVAGIATNGDIAGVATTDTNLEVVSVADLDNSQADTTLPNTPTDLTIGSTNFYATTDQGEVIAIRVNDLSTVWSENGTFSDTAAVAISDETVVVAGTDTNSDPLVAAYQRTNGAVKWTHSHHSASLTDIAANDGHVISTDTNGNVITASLEDGRQVHTQTPHGSTTVPAVAATNDITVTGDTTSSNEIIATEPPARLTNPAPFDGQPDDPTTLSVDIEDPGAGDSHTVRFYNQSNGNEIGSTTLTGDGTATVQWNHDTTTPSRWNATIESSGGTIRDVTGTITTNAPDRIELRQETGSHQLISQNLNVTVRLFGGSQIITRETSDGTINMSGLPDEEFFVTVRPPDGSVYTDRTMYVPDIYQRTTVYLLDTTSTTVVEPTFVLDDVTGQFGPDSVVYIEKPITRGGSTAYEPVYAEQFGPDGATAELESSVRYRARVLSQDGQERQLDALTITSSKVITFRVTRLSQGVESTTGQGVLINTSQDVTGSGGSKQKQVEFFFQDTSNNTTSLDLTIHESGNASNVFATTSASQASTPLGTFRYQDTFQDEPANTSLVANVTYVQSGETYNRTIAFGVNTYPIDIPLGPGWSQIFGVGFLIVLGGVFSVANARIGALFIPGVALVLYQIQLLNGIITVLGVGLAFTLAVAYNLMVTSGPDGVTAQ